MQLHDEGVVKFFANHKRQSLPDREVGALLCSLTAWREVMAKMQLVGQELSRYGGAGYGNVSGRLGAPSSPRARRPFLITGTQTGGIPCIGPDHFCVVNAYDYRENRVESVGPIEPSSESMTHGAIYDLTPTIRFVFHGHSPTLWQRAKELRLPTTDAGVPYGTPEMATEVQRLYRDSPLPELQILAMGGHEDGIIVFGRNAAEAGQVMITQLARAYEQQCREGKSCFIW